ncbi:MAG: AMP-binding protein [Acidimicrobiales bacterium]
MVATTSGAAMLTLILGALRSGIVPVLLNSALLADERAALERDAEPSLIVDDELLAQLLAGPPGELAPWPLARPMHYTSGTTGVPKGVWSGLLDEVEAAALLAEEADQWGFGPADRHLVCSPFHHSVSIRFGGGTLLAGGTVVVLGRFDAAEALDAVATLGVTTSFMVPAHLQRIHAAAGGTLAPLEALRSLVRGRRARRRCSAAVEALDADRVWEFYGSTEGQFTACSARVAGAAGHRRSRPCRAAPGRGGGGRGARPAQARHPWRPRGRASCGAARRRGGGSATGASGQDGTGLAVGRRVRLVHRRRPGTIDDDGYLFLEGRRDDLIISGRVNVYPAEVERVLVDAPGVGEVAVFRRADERWGQRVCAAVVPDPGGPAPDPEVIVGWARQHLAAHKRPKEVHVVDDLPRTSTGKVQRLRIAATLGVSG